MQLAHLRQIAKGPGAAGVLGFRHHCVYLYREQTVLVLSYRRCRSPDLMSPKSSKLVMDVGEIYLLQRNLDIVVIVVLALALIFVTF